MGFVKFMASTAGRVLRAVAGLVLVYVGYFVIKGIGGDILALVGIVPFAAGVFDFCFLAIISLNRSKSESEARLLFFSNFCAHAVFCQLASTSCS